MHYSEHISIVILLGLSGGCFLLAAPTNFLAVGFEGRCCGAATANFIAGGSVGGAAAHLAQIFWQTFFAELCWGAATANFLPVGFEGWCCGAATTNCPADVFVARCWGAATANFLAVGFVGRSWGRARSCTANFLAGVFAALCWGRSCISSYCQFPGSRF